MVSRTWFTKIGTKVGWSEHPSGRKFRMVKIDCLIHPHFSRVQIFLESCKSMRLALRLANAARTVLIVVTKGQTCLRETATAGQTAVNKEAAADRGREAAADILGGQTAVGRELILIFNVDGW